MFKCRVEGCGCPCHTSKYVVHVIPCCSTPSARDKEDMLQLFKELEKEACRRRNGNIVAPVA